MFKIQIIYLLVCCILCIAFFLSVLSEGEFVFMRAFLNWISTFRFRFLVAVKRLVIYRCFSLSAASMFSNFKNRFHSKLTNKVAIFQYDIYISHYFKLFILFSTYLKNWNIETLLTIPLKIY